MYCNASHFPRMSVNFLIINHGGVYLAVAIANAVDNDLYPGMDQNMEDYTNKN